MAMRTGGGDELNSEINSCASVRIVSSMAVTRRVENALLTKPR